MFPTSTSYRIRQEPEWDQCREIEWSNSCKYIQGLTNSRLVDSPGDVFNCTTVFPKHIRDTGSYLNVLDTSTNLAAGLTKWLAVFLCERPRDFVPNELHIETNSIWWCMRTVDLKADKCRLVTDSASAKKYYENMANIEQERIILLCIYWFNHVVRKKRT
jgi:hypothetical protein